MKSFLEQKDIVPVRIPTPFAVGEVCCYLIMHEKIVLVDCGHYSDDALYMIKNVLRNGQLDWSDIDEIWLTHGHPDHFGQAARLAERSGAVVVGHPKERSNFAGNSDRDLFATFFEEYHIPDLFISAMIKQLEWLQQYQQPVEPEWVEDGELLETGDMEFRVKHTPGHAPGHICFYSDEGIIFGGDLLLEHVSTNALINFDPETNRRNRSLLQYRESLEWIRTRTGMVLPGHGNFIHNIRVVSDHHLEEHEKRFLNICNLIQKHPMSLTEIGSQVFPDIMNRENIFLILSEITGYLDWGRQEGKIEEIEQKGTIMYRRKV